MKPEAEYRYAIKNYFSLIQIKEKIPLVEHNDRKYNLWTGKKDGYEATVGMLKNELLGGMRQNKLES